MTTLLRRSLPPWLAAAGLLLSVPAAPAQPAGEQGAEEARPDGADLAVRWTVLSNRLEGENRSRQRLTLHNRGGTALPASGWALHFNYLRVIDPSTAGPWVELTRVNGTFYRLEPAAGFEPIPPGGRRAVRFESRHRAIKASDAPAGVYLAHGDSPGDARPPEPLGEVTVGEFPPPGPGRRYPSPASRYHRNERLLGEVPGRVGRITPTPLRTERRDGAVRLTPSTPIRHGGGLAGEAELLADALAGVLGARPPVERADGGGSGPAVLLRRGAVEAEGRPATREEAYRLAVEPGRGVEVVGAGAAGVFYGVQSLRALLPPGGGPDAASGVSVPAVRVTDRPRFPYRGLHLDVARNFREPVDVKRLLDLMGLYKLNRLHLHLTDDEGWRLAVRGLPELTRVGGRRGHTRTEHEHLIPAFGSGPDPDTAASAGSGWYSAEEYREILRYAARRHVQVVPEVDVPGHARAAVVAMEARHRRLVEEGRPEAASRYRLVHPGDTSSYESVQGWDDNVVDACRPATYRFLERVIDELRRLHREAGAPLTAVHVGGDEVPEGAWVGSPACHRLLERTDSLEGTYDLPAYFQRRARGILAERGLAAAGWGSVARGGEAAGPAPRAYAWRNLWGSGREDAPYRLANEGQEVVLAQASTLYFDMAYSAHPEERGNYWAGFVDSADPHGLLPLEICRSVRPGRGGGEGAGTEDCGAGVALTSAGRRNVLGLQGQLWSEMLPSPDRMEYMAVPRLLGLAERAWAPRPGWAGADRPGERYRRWSDAWTEFAARLGRRELPRISRLDPGWDYRLPPPGAVVTEDGRLEANVALPGLTVRYTTDGSRPASDSPPYTGPVEIEPGDRVKLRTFGPGGRGSRTAVASPGGG